MGEVNGMGCCLTMPGAAGRADRIAPREVFSDYENATATGQAHVWFEEPDGGWTV